MLIPGHPKFTDPIFMHLFGNSVESSIIPDLGAYFLLLLDNKIENARPVKQIIHGEHGHVGMGLSRFVWPR